MTPNNEEKVKDFLSGFSPEKREAVLNLLSSKKGGETAKIKESLYRCKCPTPDEFLTYEWIGEASEKIFPEVRRMFKEMWEYDKMYSEVILYGATRCLGVDTPVLMYDGGIKKVQEIQVGDLLMGPDGQKRTVSELYRGEGNL
jgi:hypothetical protein